MRYGLLGEKLGHSFSPQIHRELGKYRYSLVEKSPRQVEGFLKKREFIGLNVTIPYKKTVIPFLDELSPQVQMLGAVNTVVNRDGRLIGHNTDYFGFKSMVEKSGLSPARKKVLVLGTGGASATVQAVMKELGANVVVISRNGKENYMTLYRHTDAAIIVNATPVGMYPNVGLSPICLGQFLRLEGVLDLIYNPAKTQLLMEAEERGIVAMNGLWMLVAQAKESVEWFTNQTIPNSQIGEVYSKIRRQNSNIVLIGMPGCGKSTVAQVLAKRLGHTPVDADEKIQELAGMTIPEIFAQGGEERFRQLESQVLRELGMQTGLIIATGGGCVTRKSNLPPLRQNGTIFWLTRSLDKLPTTGRPLSISGHLHSMYKARKPLYERFADYEIDNDGDIKATVAQIISIVEGME